MPPRPAVQNGAMSGGTGTMVKRARGNVMYLPSWPSARLEIHAARDSSSSGVFA